MRGFGCTLFKGTLWKTKMISRTDASKPMAAITFDDGPSATSLSDPAYRIIRAFSEAGFRATFFCVSDWCKSESQIKFAFESGMEIANHTKSHPHLPNLSESQIREEFSVAQEWLGKVIGREPPKIMRPPYLEADEKVKNALADIALISCSIDTRDWAGATKEEILATIRRAKEDGSLKNAIVLCHENYEATAEAMEEILPQLKEEGWQLVTVSEMFAENGKAMRGGTLYRAVE